MFKLSNYDYSRQRFPSFNPLITQKRKWHYHSFKKTNEFPKEIREWALKYLDYEINSAGRLHLREKCGENKPFWQSFTWLTLLSVFLLRLLVQFLCLIPRILCSWMKMPLCVFLERIPVSFGKKGGMYLPILTSTNSSSVSICLHNYIWWKNNFLVTFPLLYCVIKWSLLKLTSKCMCHVVQMQLAMPWKDISCHTSM